MYRFTAKNAVVLIPRWRSLSSLLTPALHRPFFPSTPPPLIRQPECIFCFKERKLYTKATRKHKQTKVSIEEKDYAHVIWWNERLQMCRKPSSILLVKRLTFSNLLGVDTTLKNGTLKEGNLNWEILQFKSKFPREVLLCRVGDFYESIGVDACILVEYAGLNPFGGLRSDSIPRAGCPVMNLRQTLDDLTRNGFSVCIVEEVQGPTQSRTRKSRFISGHAHPGSPYVFGLVGNDHDLEFPDPMPVVGISRSAKGYCMVSVLETMKTYSAEDNLTEEAVVTKLRTCRCHHLFLHTSLRHNSSEVNLERVEHFVQALATHENAIFIKRRKKQKARKNRGKRFPFQMSSGRISDAKFVVDKVNLGEDGWKERYYTEKFQVQTDDDRERVQKHAVLKYVEGICWVMHYYYQGVCSWQWFYPYHYAPFASDFHGLDQLEVDFVLGKPFKPLDQLMGVLPAASAGALPLLYRDLMTDPSSPILDFYPTEFELDLNGRKQEWKAVCRLPFIDEDRLLTEIAKVESTLTGAERQRNTLGLDKLFIDISHPLAAKILTFWERNKDNAKLHKAKVKKKINPKLSAGMNGFVYVSDKPICPPEIPSPLCGMNTIEKNTVLFVFYKYPHFHPHIPRPPEGVRMPEKTIGKQDLLHPPTLWHENTIIAQSTSASRPTPPEPVAEPCLAESSQHLVTETCSNEDHGKVGKRSHDAMDGNSQKRKKRNKRRKLNSVSLAAPVAA